MSPVEQILLTLPSHLSSLRFLVVLVTFVFCVVSYWQLFVCVSFFCLLIMEVFFLILFKDSDYLFIIFKPFLAMVRKR
jgi:hypothetical protein